MATAGITKKDLEEVLGRQLDKKLDSKFAEYDKKLDSRFTEYDKKLDSRFTEYDKKLDSKFGEYQESILEAVNVGFENTHREINGLRESIQQLTITLDGFVKQLNDRDEEITIMKAELNKIKFVIKEKLGV